MCNMFPIYGSCGNVRIAHQMNISFGAIAFFYFMKNVYSIRNGYKTDGTIHDFFIPGFV